MSPFYNFFILFCMIVIETFAIKVPPNRPKLYVSDGNLNIFMPENKHIRVSTSRFLINNYELVSTLEKGKNASKLLSNYERFMAQYHSKIDDIENRLLNLRSDSLLSNSTNTTARDQNVNIKLRRIERRLGTLHRTISSLKLLLSKDDCTSNPCQNGGVCLDMFNGFLCQCQNGWEGPACEKDIDECTRFKGTDLGCQNGGTCQNLPGTYQCYCQNGWIGLRCDRKPTDCTSGGYEICGHGTCIPQNNAAGYKCICDPGWTTDGTHQACTVDVDECKLNHPPCSTNPLVLCINIPGSFVCQHCPPGYTGNGYYCADINECELFNGGCSVSPFVECVNTPGSSKCGPCPPGYQGEGKICSYRGICNVNNGGCHLVARCVDNAAISDAYVQCLCPAGYTGSGIGPNGCFRANFSSNTCSPNPCVHGSCVANNSPQGFSCICDQGYAGIHCERASNPCAINPCLNGGTCQVRRGQFTCKCPSGFSGKRCIKEQQGCGGNLKAPNGTIRYPETDFTSRSSQPLSCAWTITVDELKVIQINFTEFKILSDRSCSTQWLQIHDGKSSSATPLGRYCGTTLPLNGSITTTQNVVYFWLRSTDQRGPEIKIDWVAKTPECGGMIKGGTGLIASPGWPSNYPNNRDCFWYFRIPTNMRLLFHIYTLNIGQDSGCKGDYLEFYAINGVFTLEFVQAFHRLEDQLELFGKFCNSTIPEPFYSTFYQGYIHFKSNEKDTYSGFQIGYSTVSGVPGCGGTYTNRDGYIQSIVMTSSMPKDLICVYEIKLPVNTTIQLEIVEMDLEDSCDISCLAIFQGKSTGSELLGRYCGNSLPGAMTTFGNNVLIESTSKMYRKNHWKIKYNAVCTRRFTDPVGSIISSLDTGECIYHIEQPVGNIISLELKLHGIYFSSRNCGPYYVEVRDGDNENSTLIGRYCKTGDKIKIESSTNYLRIYTRISVARGFIANYTTLDIGCGGLLKKELGTVAFPPQGSGKYTANKRCRWVIMAPNDKVIQLTWMTFNVEQSFDCTYDHVEVFDNNTGDGMGGSMGKYCGYSLPPVMLSSSNIMTIDFISDTTIHGDGFTISYTFIKENNVCGANYFTSAGVIKSPGYPNNYPTNRECIWAITVPPGNQIMLNVTDFNVEAYSSCRYDWLEIRNGGTSSSPLIGRYCGTTIPKMIPSHANKLFLKFNSDMSRTTQGFKIQWTSAATGCGGSLTSPSGAIMSPHYPEPYTKNTDCLWKIVISAGLKIQIIFADLDLEKHSVCGLDYIQLFDGPAINSKSLGKFCSPQTSPIISSGNTMLVRFRSDVSFQGRGFNIQYSAICKNTLTGFGGVIESPNFPNDYPQDQNCLWDIIVSEKNKINITFSHFALERSTTFENKSCQFDYVEIEYKVDTSYTDSSEEPQYQKYGRYCGHTNPGLITLDSNHARVHFVSDSLLLGTGFRLEWRLFGCGGMLTDTSGKITSPNYPKSYPPNVECNWVISVPLGQSINITVEKIEVEKDNNCVYDYVNLYNGIDASYQLLSTICHQLKPITVTSTGNNMFIQFKADSSYQGTGFIAKYQTEPTSCGGQLTAPSGYVFSPNYPKNYNRNETCEWLISTDEHHLIELTFINVDLVRTECNKTYIKVYDGPSQAYPVLETICGNTEPNKTIKSTYENLFIEFKSDSYLTSKGFRAKYQKACGATVKTSGSGSLKIDRDFISSQTESGVCRYTIQAEDKSQHVTLTITFMSQTGWCDNEDEYGSSLKIYNGPFSNSPLIGNYCGSKIPPSITSDGSALHLEFHQSIDFFASYTVLDDQCGGDLRSQDGFFASPGWPKTYPNNIQCTWTISMGPGNTINLNFLNFDIPESDHCNTDFLEIRASNASGKLLGVYCGTNMPSNLTSVGTIYLLFRSSTLDEGVTTVNKGFKAEYATSTENKLSGPEGLIGSPHYPEPISIYGYYSWLITTKPGTRIEITFIEFFMESGYDEDDCSGSPFKLFDGMDGEAQVLLEICGSDIPRPVLSSSNMAFLTLDYYSNRLENKFLLKWKGLNVAKKSGDSNKTSDCQFIYSVDTRTNQTVSSPGYPNGYAPNLNCEWIFETSLQNHLKLRLLDRNFGPWSNYRSCAYADFIKVYQKQNKNGEWEMITEICNNSNTYEDFFGTNLIKMEFQTNKYLNGTGFEAQVFSVCGGTLNGPSGYIIFNNTISHEHECQWNISVKSGRTIKLTFAEFDLTPNDPNNCKNYLIIRNGKFSDSPYLGNGKFCGPDIPPEMESSSNHVYLKFTSRGSVKGFKIFYEEVSINCGQHYQLSSEKSSLEISSPNYPNIPPVHSECVWTLRAPTGEALRVDFEDRFDIGRSDRPDCTKDYLELRDGGTELAPLIGTFCYETPSTQFSTDNMLRVKFFTDSDEPRNGFKAKVSISYCGGTFREPGAETLSTKKPHAIGAGSNCTWYIKAPLGFFLTMKFLTFHVSTHSSNCSRNDMSKVHLYEHSSLLGNDTSLGTYCGQINISEPIRSSSNEVVVNYVSKSDQDEFSLAFKTWRENCSGTLIQETGTLTSPGYPQVMHENRYCFWRIQVPKGRRITIVMEDADFDGTYLAIYQGFMEGPKILQSLQSNVKTGDRYETSDNAAHILYWQQVTSNKRGFKMTFSSDKPTFCIGDFNQTSGEILAPVTTKPYKCEWEHIKKTSNETLAIEVVMESNVTMLGLFCRRSSTGIHIFSAKSEYVAKICQSSNNSPFVFRSPYSITTLIARENARNKLNFTISYKTFKCGGIIENKAGTISSPNFPNKPGTSMECSWVISLNSEHKIKINITTMNLGNDCDKSYLIIYNGNSQLHPRIGRYCKNSKPDLIITQTNRAVIEYKYAEGGDSSTKGFILNYEPEIHGCGGIYQQRTDTIQTPNYSQDYPNNAECLWEIRAKDGNLVKLKFVDRFYIEESENCAKDYIEIFDWKDDKWISLGRKCGRNLPEEIVSSNTKLKMLFRTDDKITGSGFKAYWDWHCGGELEASKQARYLMSPGYPNNLKANCTYKIITKNDKGIVNIKFLDFNLDTGNDCSHSNLTIIRRAPGRGMSATQQLYCGQNTPGNLRLANSITITYRNSQSNWRGGHGFKLVYKDESCGGNITSPTVIDVPSTNTDNQANALLRYYQTRVSCTWYVTAPSNQIAVLSVEKLEMSLQLNCISQSLEVYDGLLAKQSKRLATLCGKLEESKPIPSPSNTLLIKLDTPPYNFEGFKGEIYFTYGPSAGCGGTINLTQTTYLNSPNNLPHMDCHWTIIAPRDQKVQLEFTQIKISGACDNPIRNYTYFCSCSFIEVNDGGGPFADKMSTLCSSDSNSQRIFTTSWNTAYVRLYSAVAQNNIFSLTLKAIKSKCGPSELTVQKQFQELTSPDYPNSYPDDIKCTWVLKSPSLLDKIILHFEDFDLLDSSGVSAVCDDDRLLVTDDPNRHIVSTGYGPTAKYQVPSATYYRIAYNKFSFCGNGSKPFDFYSAGDTITLSFQSYPYSGTRGRGFKIKYALSGCNRTIRANEGRIQSSHSDKNNCILTITADTNRTISIYFLQFYILYSNSNCTSYGLEIRENNSTGRELLRACGFRTPNPVFSNSNQLYIRAYNHRGTNTFSQYKFLFMSSEHGRGCGGKIFDFSGKFSSPMYPDVLRQDIECTWDVQVPRGYKVALKLSVFDITGACEKNKVVVKTWHDSASTDHTFCSQDVPAVLFSEAALQLTYYSSVNNGGTGWSSSFQAVKEESDQILWI